MNENNMAQFFFSKIESGYDSIHSLMRENFETQDNPTPSIVRGDLIVVQSYLNPKISRPLLKRSIVFPKIETKAVKILSHLSFDNRHRTGNIIPPRLRPNEALKKLDELAGLKPLDGACAYFLGCHREIKFNVHNTFKFEGWFQISDIEKFKKAILYGVGSRKSYGYGLILIEEEG